MEGNYLNRNTTQQREDHSFGFEEHSWGTSWPARNYACSFCKRQFRSAQALGGHMNVHRRDRARLRSSLSSWVNSSDQCPKPNPNTKPNNNPSSVLHQPSSSPSPLSDHKLLNCPQYPPPCLSLSSSSPSTASTSGDKKPRLTFTPSHHFPLLSPQRREINNTRNGFIVEEEMKGSCEEDEEEHKVYKNNEQNVTLELGLGLVEHQEEKLDLELRL